MAANFLRHGFAALYRGNIKNQFATNQNISTQLRGLHLSTSFLKRVSFNLSDIGEGIREVTVKEWFVKVGDTVEQFDNLCEVQSDKASVTITSRYDGKIVQLHHKIDDIALVGKPLLDFEVADEDENEVGSSSEEETKGAAVQNEAVSSTTSSESIARQISLATPAVRRIAKENNVDLSKVSPTGRNGRVLKGDVLEFLGHIPAGTNLPHPSITPKVNQTSPVAPTTPPADRVEPLKGVRKAMLKAMTESLKIPHFAYSDEIDLTNLVKFRDQMRVMIEQVGAPKITFMPFFIKAASIALSKYPILNSSLDLESESVIYRGAHNISVAIDTPSGLVVPNVKNCQSKNITEIAHDLNALIERGRSDKLTPNDFMDGTFSLSNIGVVGGTYTHPCIMAPQVAIGAMGRTKVVPRFNEHDEIVKAYIMNVSWCADHRVIDGVTMASFSNLWKQYLENPALFLLH